MDGILWGDVLTLNADSSALPELAREGIYGIEVVLIVSVVAMSCFFLWSFCKRETRREKELLEMGQSWSSAINRLTVTLQEYVDCTSAAFGQIRENVARIGDGIEAVCARVGENEKTLARHEEVIVRHEDQLNELEKAKEGETMAKSCGTKKKGCRGSKRGK